MRGLTSLAVMAVVLVGLGSYIYLSQSQRTPPPVEVKPRAIEIKQDEIQEFTFKPAAGEASTIVKSGDGWQITAPMTAPADDAVISRLVAVVSSLELTRVVEEKPEDLAQFGLAPPQLEVTIKTSGPNGTLQVLLGGKAPVGSNVYARLSSNPRVILIPSELQEIAGKSPLELRNNNIFSVNRDKIDRLQIDAAGHSIDLVKHDVEWELTKPIATRGDLGFISELLTKLMTQKMAAIVETPPARSAAWRFDAPVATVTVSAGTNRETVLIGGKADADNRYARNLSRPMVFTVPTSLIDQLKTDPSPYRRKDVFDFQTIEATRVEVARNGGTAVWEKSSAKGSEGKWQELSPKARISDPAKVDNMLSKLSYLRALTFVPLPPALTSGPDVIAVTVKFDDGKKSESVRLGKPGDTAMATRTDWSDAATLDANAYALLVASLDELQK